MPAPTPTPLTVSQAILRWVAYAFVFVIFGGVGAGLTALLYVLVVPEPFSDVLYAAMFAGCGLIAYRLAQRVDAGRSG